MGSRMNSEYDTRTGHTGGGSLSQGVGSSSSVDGSVSSSKQVSVNGGKLKGKGKKPGISKSSPYISHLPAVGSQISKEKRSKVEPLLRRRDERWLGYYLFCCAIACCVRIFVLRRNYDKL